MPAASFFQTMTRTNIANMALAKLGAEPISDLATDQTKEGVHARLWYDQALGEVLRSHFWNFAMWVSQIAAVPEVEHAATGTLALGRLDGGVLVEAVTPGAGGNSIVVTVADPTPEQESASANGNSITLFPTYKLATVAGTLAYLGSPVSFAFQVPRVTGAFGTIDGHPLFGIEPATAIGWETTTENWIIGHPSGATWTSSENVASPDLVQTWTPGPDTTGTPVVTVGLSLTVDMIAAAVASASVSALVTLANATGSDGSAQVVPGDTVRLAGGISKSVDWQGAFPLPGDFLKLREVTNLVGDKVESFDIRRVNGARCLLASGLDAVFLEYVQLVDAPGDYDPLFIAAFTTLLAARMALAITGSKDFETALLGQYLNEDLPAARAADGQDTRSNENRSLTEFLAGDLLRSGLPDDFE